MIYACTVNGRTFSADPSSPPSTPAQVERVGDGLWAVTIRGRRFEVAVQDGTELRLAREAAPSKHARGERILAPMPGVVTRVAVAKGQAVKAGDLLVVLEAMKMANEVCAKAAGTVLDLPVAAGRTVSAGEVLVALG